MADLDEEMVSSQLRLTTNYTTAFQLASKIISAEGMAAFTPEKLQEHLENSVLAMVLFTVTMTMVATSPDRNAGAVHGILDEMRTELNKIVASLPRMDHQSQTGSVN